MAHIQQPLAATVIVPTTGDRAAVLRSSLESILSQTVQDLEVFVIGDGASESSREVIEQYCANDERVRFFDHPKGARRGEGYRHAALANARGKIVCYLCDRDYMLPDHIDILYQELAEVDFAHTLPFRDNLDHSVFNLASGNDRWRILAGLAYIPLSLVGHTLAAYRRLPYGWRKTPEGNTTDRYMWQQFLAQDWLKASTIHWPTILYFPTSKYGRDFTSIAEQHNIWHQRVVSDNWSDFLHREVLKEVCQHRSNIKRRYDQTLEGRLADLRVRALYHLRQAKLMRRILGLWQKRR